MDRTHGGGSCSSAEPICVISQKAKLIVNKCHQLNKNTKKIINIYVQIIKVQTPSKLTGYFLNEYNVAVKTQSDQNKIEKVLNDKLDLPRIKIEEFIKLQLDTNTQY